MGRTGRLCDRLALILHWMRLASDPTRTSVPNETPLRVADFHSLRGAYISNLAAGGASVKTCQVLARHSTPSLTIGVYAKASPRDNKGTMDSLPDLSGSEPAPTTEATAARATGTKQRRICIRFPNYLSTGGDGAGRSVSTAVGSDDVMNNSDAVLLTDRSPLFESGVAGFCRLVSDAVESAGDGIRTHTEVPLRRILSPLRLPFRHAGCRQSPLRSQN